MVDGGGQALSLPRAGFSKDRFIAVVWRNWLDGHETATLEVGGSSATSFLPEERKQAAVL